jgi:opine dehydrogenase
MRVCLVGGGNIAHALIADADFDYVSLLTSKPCKFDNEIVGFSDGKDFKGKIDLSTSNPEVAIFNVDVIIITTPSFLYGEVLDRIYRYVKNDMWLGSIHATGAFDWMVRKVMPHHQKLFGFQRTPYVSRIDVYGKFVSFNKKKLIKVYSSLSVEHSRSFVEELSNSFDIEIIQLNSFLEITLSNSNPLLHPTRLYSIFNNICRYHKDSLFYGDWDNDSSKVLVECDRELQLIAEKIPVDLSNITSILDHYDSDDICQLTKKIVSIQSWSDIKIEFDKNSLNLTPDTTSRYFLEDVAFGLVPIKGVAQIVGLDTPCIDRVLLWCQQIMKKNFINNGMLNGIDIKETCAPQNFNIRTVSSLIRNSH